jgi:ATP-dependent protease ClpP protease subunit
MDNTPNQREGLRGGATRMEVGREGMVIGFYREIDDDSILELCDHIETAFGYYSCGHVELRINSPGGSVAALEHYISRLRGWMGGGRRPVLATTAMSSVSSAAAVILSLGTIGHRRAYPSARILYHNARARIPDGAMLTAGQLATMGSGIEKADLAILEELTRHIGALAALRGRIKSLAPASPEASGGAEPFAWVDVGPGGGTPLSEHYSKLSALDVPIDPWTARDMLLIDEVIEQQTRRME